jgi:hypothetical protein
MMRILALLALCPSLASAELAPGLTPVIADGLVTPGSDCQATMTVQIRGCMVRTVMLCAPAKGAGPRIVVVQAHDNGQLIYLLDDDFQTLQIEDPSYGNNTVTDMSGDMFSIRALLTTGSDSFAFSVTNEDGSRGTLGGTRVLTGEVVMIDGREQQLVKSVVSASYPDQSQERRSETSFYDPALGVLLLGSVHVEGMGEVVDFTPVDFIGPGEAGFLSTIPTEGCAG